eukprot:TRINITY_DN2802_c0_g1_i2.p1 TRINITY_DN2802_c0_g1~~TRINITY_DN2802_c0_g1_i2.p1  ORF type:complete len:297 (-),score=38.21 TRINITY_DN2802_c0_g1_i2:257-1147(-)
MATRTAGTVTFNVEFHTGFGEDVTLVGSAPELGQWNTKRGVKLYTSEVDFPFWTSPPISLSLPREEPVLYKYVLTTADGRVEWESGPDRKISRTSFPDVLEQDVSIEDFASRHHAPTMERRPSQIKLSSSYSACRGRLVATILALMMVAATMHAASMVLRRQLRKEPLANSHGKSPFADSYEKSLFADSYEKSLFADSYVFADSYAKRLARPRVNSTETLQTTSEGLSKSVTRLGRSLFEAMLLARRDFMVLVFTLKMNVTDFLQKAGKGLLVLAIFFAGAAVRAPSFERRQRCSW